MEGVVSKKNRPAYLRTSTGTGRRWSAAPPLIGGHDLFGHRLEDTLRLIGREDIQIDVDCRPGLPVHQSRANAPPKAWGMPAASSRSWNATTASRIGLIDRSPLGARTRVPEWSPATSRQGIDKCEQGLDLFGQLPLVVRRSRSQSESASNPAARSSRPRW